MVVADVFMCYNPCLVPSRWWWRMFSCVTIPVFFLPDGGGGGNTGVVVQQQGSEDLSSIQCHLETKELWDKFNELGTEMIITKSGR